MIGLQTHLAPAGSISETDMVTILNVLDQLHDAAATNQLSCISDMDRRLIYGWLQDIQHTTAEILEELAS